MGLLARMAFSEISRIPARYARKRDTQRVGYFGASARALSAVAGGGHAFWWGAIRSAPGQERVPVAIRAPAVHFLAEIAPLFILYSITSSARPIVRSLHPVHQATCHLLIVCTSVSRDVIMSFVTPLGHHRRRARRADRRRAH